MDDQWYRIDTEKWAEWVSYFESDEVDLQWYVEQGVLVPVEPITVICKHNTPDALTTSLFLSPVDAKAIPEGTYALVKLGDREDDGIGDTE